MHVAVHELPGQPVLMSIKSLRALGAVIDYDRDEMILKKVNSKKVVKLERADSGHQLFPMVTDEVQELRRALNKAARKKSDLQAFCTQQLGLELTMNETIEKLKVKAESVLAQKAPPRGDELMGFGKHAGLEMILKKVNSKKVVKLERADSGHQLFPMVTDIYQGAAERRSSFESLASE
eukprot:s3875_g4.t1